RRVGWHYAQRSRIGQRVQSCEAAAAIDHERCQRIDGRCGLWRLYRCMADSEFRMAQRISVRRHYSAGNGATDDLSTTRIDFIFGGLWEETGPGRKVAQANRSKYS